ncbi:MAG: hypothetical protein HYY24_23570 [Verrucomicrobia bacterium]|nr:hypothetical protein [Verrucomicrobiota bacterium]
MNEGEFNRLLEAAQRRRLTAEEEASARAYLLEHPEAQVVWDDELALSQLLGQLPPAPVPSNFTTRVLQAVAREEHAVAAGAHARWRAWLRAWTPLKAAAAGSVAVLVVLLAYQQNRLSARTELARNLATFSQAAMVPGVEVLQDFDAIRLLSQLPQEVDVELTSAPQ